MANIVELDGYNFIMNRDQYYHDIIHLPNKSIGELKKVADSLENCVGFNTAGYLKSHITSDLSNYPNQNANTISGLYVKKSFPLKVLTGPAGMEDTTGSIQTHIIKYFTLSTVTDLTTTGETIMIDGQKYIFLPNVDCTDFTYLYLPKQSLSNLNKFLVNDPTSCIGFTSDGFLKYYISSQYLIQKTNPSSEDRGGLYINVERYKSMHLRDNSGTKEIPKIIHFHLADGETFSAINLIAIKSAILHNPSYKIQLHCSVVPVNNPFFEAIRESIEIMLLEEGDSNLKYLYSTGGIYLDLNILTVKSYDEYLTGHHTVMTYENINKNSVSKEIIMTIPQNPFIKEWMKFAPKIHMGDLPFKLSDKYHIHLVLPNFTSKIKAIDHTFMKQIAATTDNNTNGNDGVNNVSGGVKGVSVNDKYFFYSNKDSDMYDYMYVNNKSLKELFEISDSDPKIQGFLYNGSNGAVMKYDLIPELKNHNYGNSQGGIYVKRDFVKPTPETETKVYNIKPICNWCSPDEIRNNLNKMTLNGYYNWNNLLMNTYLPNVDYFVIINKPYDLLKETYDPARTIVFQMEPMRDNKEGDYGVKTWGEWAHPSREKFLMVNDHKWFCNNLEWHLGKTYKELMEERIEKTDGHALISAVVSNKLLDEGHHKRLDFLKYLQEKECKEMQKSNNEGGMAVDIYGRCQSLGFKNYKGELPPMNKDAGILPYKYHFVCENNQETNYITEKLIDGILGEALCFYWGCPNVATYLDPRAYVTLELNDFEADYNKIKQCIANNEWEKRLPIIRAEKRRILTQLQLMPRLERIINTHNSKLYETFFDHIVIVGGNKMVAALFNKCGVKYDEVEDKDRALSRYMGKVLMIGRYAVVTEVMLKKFNLILQEMIDNKLESVWSKLYLTPISSGDGNSNEMVVTKGKQISSFLYQIDDSKVDWDTVSMMAVNMSDSVSIFDNNYVVYPYLFDERNKTRIEYQHGGKYETYCVNLERRADRRVEMDKIFGAQNYTDYKYFKAVDGKELKMTIDILKQFAGNDFSYRCGFIGCALSHINLWKQLVEDSDGNDMYLIMEDDVKLVDNFKDKLQDVMKELGEYGYWDITYIGYSMYSSVLNSCVKEYRNDEMPMVVPFDSNKAVGGFFGYIINKFGAKKLLDYIATHSINHGIDYYVKKYAAEMNLVQLETKPHLVLTEWVTTLESPVDSDIQKDFKSVIGENNVVAAVDKMVMAVENNVEVSVVETPDIYCVNLERRQDRKAKMIKLFEENGMKKYEFYKAVDGKQMRKSDYLLKLFEGNDFGYRCSVIGCAMSHINIWKLLVADSAHEMYLVVEDDIEVANNFKMRVEKVKEELMARDTWDIVYLGYHMQDIVLKEYEEVCRGDAMPYIRKINKEWYVGGTFGYYISKNGAKKLLNYFETHSIIHGFDYYLNKFQDEIGLNILEVVPHLVMSDWVKPNDWSVDSDIQKDHDHLLAKEY